MVKSLYRLLPWLLSVVTWSVGGWLLGCLVSGFGWWLVMLRLLLFGGWFGRLLWLVGLVGLFVVGLGCGWLVPAGGTGCCHLLVVGGGGGGGMGRRWLVGFIFRFLDLVNWLEVF
jgi:hypothetical protein